MQFTLPSSPCDLRPQASRGSRWGWWGGVQRWLSCSLLRGAALAPLWPAFRQCFAPRLSSHHLHLFPLLPTLVRTPGSPPQFLFPGWSPECTAGWLRLSCASLCLRVRCQDHRDRWSLPWSKSSSFDNHSGLQVSALLQTGCGHVCLGACIRAGGSVLWGCPQSPNFSCCMSSLSPQDLYL